MNKVKTLSAAALVLAATASPWELSASVGYGACFIDGAPNGYKYPKGEEFFPDAKTTEPLAVALGASFGRLAVAASYAQRYELYSEAGKVHDFSLLGRPLLWSHNAWELRGEAGVAVSRAPAPPAFLYGKTGPTHDWTAAVGADVGFQPFTWLSSRAGVSYRERPQVINFIEGEWYSYYGTVKSPAIDLTAHCLFAPWRYIRVGPSFQQIFYGPYDYYLYGGTNQNEGWVTGKETYVMGIVAIVIPF
jgi:hypothetical protein